MRKFGWVLLILGWLCFFLSFSFEDKYPFNLLPGCLEFGAIIGIFGGALLIVLSGRGKKIRNGQLVVGTVTSVKQTAVGLNSGRILQIKLSIQFTTLDGQQITATVLKFVWLANLAQFQLGTKLPIRYNPKKPQNIMIDLKADKAQLQHARNEYYVSTGKMTQSAMNIKENGVQAQGIVLDSKSTGNIVDGSGEMIVHVKVTRPDNTTYEVTTTFNVPPNKIPFTAPGCVVHVWYVPDNEQRIVIGWYS
ncbi:MAG: DUF3592 domain-containing protein [Desulfuromonadales bacterium]|nr:DUF3592 domain-containing protein [Desulfuromonadales bacterium]